MIAARGVHHLAIQVRDLAAAERFYCDTLGLRVVRRWPAADGAGERSIWVDTGDGAFLALEVTTAAPRTPDGDAGCPALPRRPAPGRAAHRRRRPRAPGRSASRSAGVAVYHQTAFTIYVRDPEGNRIGLSHYPVPAGEAGG